MNLCASHDTNYMKTDFLSQLSEKNLMIAICENAPCADMFEVLQETEKAIQIKALDIPEKKAFPVWVPKTAIKDSKFTLAEFGECVRLYWSPWFRKTMQAEKPWKRIALRHSC